MAFNNPTGNPPTGTGAVISVGSGASANSLYIASSSNVGIGTTGGAMLAPLSIKPTSDVPQLYLAQSNNDNGGWMFRAGMDGHLHVISNQSGQSEKMTIQYNTGNVGIGTTGPNTKLQIYGDSGNLLKLQSSTGMGTAGQAMGMTFVQSGDVEVSRIESITEANTKIGLRFYTYNGSVGERVRIDNQGNVGIGKIPGSYALDVNGTVNATAFRGDGSQLTNMGGKLYFNTTQVYNGAAPTSLTVLDLSGTIGAQTSIVMLRLAPTNQHRYGFAKTGDTISFDSGGASAVSNAYFSGPDPYVITPTDSLGRVSWVSDSSDGIIINLVGYWK